MENNNVQLVNPRTKWQWNIEHGDFPYKYTNKMLIFNYMENQLCNKLPEGLSNIIPTTIPLIVDLTIHNEDHQYYKLVNNEFP